MQPIKQIHDPARGADAPRAAASAAAGPEPGDGLRRAALALAVALTLGTAASLLAVGHVQAAETAPAPLAEPAGPPSFADVAERVTPAVVNVTVAQKPMQRMSMNGRTLPEGLPEDSPLKEFFEQFGGMQDFQMPRQREGEGSGFVVDPPATSSATTMSSSLPKPSR